MNTSTTVPGELIQLTDEEMEGVQGGDVVTVVAIIAGVIGIAMWLGGGSATFSPGANGGSVSFTGTWQQFLNGMGTLFGWY